MAKSWPGSVLFLLGCCALGGVAPAAAAGGEGDHALVGRYQDAELLGRWESEYDQASFLVGPFDPVEAGSRSGEGFALLEGRSLLLYYGLPAGRSSLEVLRNYERSLHEKGFSLPFVCATSDGSCFTSGAADAAYHLGNALGDPLLLPRLREDYVLNAFQSRGRYLFARLDRPEGTVFASVAIGESDAGGVAIVRVVETRDMDSARIVFVDADAMGRALESAGRIDLYGFHFDSGSDGLRPESKPTLEEIARLLGGRPDLRLDVIGHTDSIGAADYNLDLSRRRAATVVRALTADYGVAETRLAARGMGAASPVASNADEAGRARNRRVELVAR